MGCLALYCGLAWPHPRGYYVVSPSTSSGVCASKSEFGGRFEPCFGGDGDGDRMEVSTANGRHFGCVQIRVVEVMVYTYWVSYHIRVVEVMVHTYHDFKHVVK